MPWNTLEGAWNALANILEIPWNALEQSLERLGNHGSTGGVESGSQKINNLFFLKKRRE